MAHILILDHKNAPQTRFLQEISKEIFELEH